MVGWAGGTSDKYCGSDRENPILFLKDPLGDYSLRVFDISAEPGDAGDVGKTRVVVTLSEVVHGEGGKVIGLREKRVCDLAVVGLEGRLIGGEETSEITSEPVVSADEEEGSVIPT